MTVWFFGQHGLESVLKAGADPAWLAGSAGLQKTAEVYPAVRNTPVFNCKSLDACRTAAPPGFSWALYSQDSTSENSLWEMTHIAEAHAQACGLIHGHGLKALAFPANDIVWKTPPVPDRDQYRAFIDRDVAGLAARHADAIGVQSQGLTADPGRFARYLARTRDQAASANSGIPFFGGLATERLGQPITAEQMFAAYLAARQLCAGFWINVNRRPEVVVQFLARVNAG